MLETTRARWVSVTRQRPGGPSAPPSTAQGRWILSTKGNSILCGESQGTPESALPLTFPPHLEGMSHGWVGLGPRLPLLAPLRSSGPSPDSPGGFHTFGVRSSVLVLTLGLSIHPRVVVSWAGPSQLSENLRLPAYMGLSGVVQAARPPCWGPAQAGLWLSFDCLE